MQTLPTAATWIAQAKLATATKIEELIAAQTPSYEADEEMRGFFDQLYIDLYKMEGCDRIRAEVIPAIQKLDTEICKITLH
jgi:hypothetical protein